MDGFFETDDRDGGTPAPSAGEAAAFALLDAMPHGGVILGADGCIGHANAAFLAMLGLPVARVAGTRLADLLDGPAGPAFEAAFDGAATAETEVEVSVNRDNGTTVLLALRLAPLGKGGLDGRSLVAVDLTERHRLESRIRSLALTDELTGLYNARGFFALADQVTRVAHRAGAQVLVAFADVDGLRRINDAHGHREGSLALMDTAVILRQTCRDADLIARIGGDEFAVIGMVPKADGGPRLVERIREQLDAHNAGAGRPYALTVDVGVATGSSEPPVDIADLLHHADMAMYEARRARTQAALEAATVARS